MANPLQTCDRFVTNFDVLLTVHLSIFISVINQIDAQNFCFTISLFHASKCFEHNVLIIRISKLHYTASGIITPIGALCNHCVKIAFCSSELIFTFIYANSSIQNAS